MEREVLMRNLWIAVLLLLLVPAGTLHAQAGLKEVADRDALPEDRSAALRAALY